MVFINVSVIEGGFSFKHFKLYNIAINEKGGFL